MSSTKSLLVKDQKLSKDKDIQYAGEPCCITATIRYDDRCVNGHNTFSVTGSIVAKRGKGVCYGCIHDEIIKYFPELEKYIKWHLVSSEMPLYYIENTLYHMSDKDSFGLRKGEPWIYNHYAQFKDAPIDLIISDGLNDYLQKLLATKSTNELALFFATVDIIKSEHPYGKKGGCIVRWKFSTQLDAMHFNDAPFESEEAGICFLRAARWSKGCIRLKHVPIIFSEGKVPNIEAARECAIWPEATAEQLQDKEALLARLPKLMRQFRHDVEELGFVF